MVDLNPVNWNWSSWKAAGRNVLSYGAGAVTVALAFHFISPKEATDLTAGLNQISDGLTSLAKGVGTIASILVPVYTAWRAAHSASPPEQIKNVAAIAANGSPMNTEAKAALIVATASIPEVKKDQPAIVLDKTVPGAAALAEAAPANVVAK